MPFSRPFNFDLSTGDRKSALNGLPADVICKTSFIASKVQEFIDNQPDSLAYIRIDETSTSTGERIFLLEARDSSNGTLGVLVGDLPCPNNCVPPEAFIGPDNTFEVQHFRDVLAFNDIRFLNVHSAIRRDTPAPTATHAIYAVTDDNGNPVAQDENGDPVFTSIDSKP